MEMFGFLKRLEAREQIDATPEIRLIGPTAEPVASDQGPRSVVDDTFASNEHYDVLLIPGGPGTRREVDNAQMVEWIDAQCDKADYVATVCTGSLLLAATGRLDGRRATTNKMAFSRETPAFPGVDWVTRARWVEDGKYLTSSGVSAGMDMALALIAKLYGDEAAKWIATGSEYAWHDDATWDPFAEVHGLT